MLDLHRRLFHVVPDVVVQLKQTNRRDIAPLLVDLYRRARDSFELLEGGLDALAAEVLSPAELSAFLVALERRLSDTRDALMALDQAMDEHDLVTMDEDLTLLICVAVDELASGRLPIENGRGLYEDGAGAGSGELAAVASRSRDLRLDRRLAHRALLERLKVDDLIGS
ncbi:MAG: hypothetical protein KF901_20095 [Myxococcales bacterium]|nr:hypothetical protein [Myxococcales bacterium]